MHKPLRHLAIILAVFLGLATALPGMSQGRQGTNSGRLFSNDFLGDGQDRWHSTSYVISELRGLNADGHTPTAFGQLLEYRLRGEVIAPANLQAPAAQDRPYAGVLAYGLHSYMGEGDDVLNRIGVDVVAVGPQTGLGQFHNWVHERLGTAGPDLETQLPNAIYPTVSGEIANSIQFGVVELRPFAEAQIGVETFARLGADVFWGGRDDDQLRLRDVTTGQLYNSAGEHTGPDVEFMLGADIAHVWSSEYLPATDGYVVEPVRFRGRAGVQVSAPQADMFYGVTWLGPEFEAQPSGQLVGSLNVNLRF
jgi:hypothetical protein